MMMSRSFFHSVGLCVLLSCGLSTIVGADDSKSKETGRFALVIGNGNYSDSRNFPPLNDAITDSVHVADALKELGFTVYGDSPQINLTRKQMVDKISRFSTGIPPGALIFIYYSGHGVEIQGVNYLIPVDAKSDIKGQIGQPDLIELSALVALKVAVNGELVQDRAAGTEVKAIVAVIDACRQTGLAYDHGLAKPGKPPLNTIIAFPTLPGKTAKSPSPYATFLVTHLKEPGLRLEDIFNSTRAEVKEKTRDSQLPQEFSSLPPEPIYFRLATPPPDGTLLTSNMKEYFFMEAGKKRAVPDIPSFVSLGFHTKFATMKSEQEMRLIPEGRSFPSLDANLLRGKRCVYYLFWGMKWCIPDEDNLKTLVQQGDEPKILSGEESAEISPGAPSQVSNGLPLRFEGRSGFFLFNSGVIISMKVADGEPVPRNVILLPGFMYDALSNPKSVATPGFNYFSGARLVVDESSSQIYVAEEGAHLLLIFDSTSPGSAHQLRLGTGAPSLMVLAPKKRQLFVADSVQHQIHVIDVRTNRVLYSVAQHFRTPTLITGIALSPDESRLYVANQGGETLLSLGTISVFDLTQDGVPKPVSDIRGVNCPEGMSISPDGGRIYLASQCGGGADPLFILDTDTETVVSKSGFAVGRSIGLAPRQKKAYVARDRSFPQDAQVTVVDTSDNSILTNLRVNVDYFATTPDSKYLLATGSTYLYLIDADSDSIVTVVPFDTAPRGLGIGPSADGKTWMCYVWLPEERRLFFGGLNALLEKKK